jgi:hypothetical protein
MVRRQPVFAYALPAFRVERLFTSYGFAIGALNTKIVFPLLHLFLLAMLGS